MRTFNYQQYGENQVNDLNKGEREREDLYTIILYHKSCQRFFYWSYLQFPAFIASQNDQKSSCKGFRGSKSKRTQK